MALTDIRSLRAREILDSRGNPTIQVECVLESGTSAVAAVPSGASTGTHEAVELRDGEENRYGGKGVRGAAAAVGQVIWPRLAGMDAREQARVDEALIELDGTPQKARLGANATLGVSMAVARAAAQQAGLPLYRYLGGVEARILPIPLMNLLNGGVHADWAITMQEFMVAPVGAPCFAEGLRWVVETYRALKAILREAGQVTGVGDEGGFAPRLRADQEAVELLLAAIEKAGLRPGADLALALDPAASEFHREGRYELGRGTDHCTPLESSAMVDLWERWVNDYPIVSLEDGLAEEDWEGWVELRRRLGDRIQLVGDDIFCTNLALLERGIQEGAANAILIKLNQIGTVTETMDAVARAHRAGWSCVVSHRSGETEDTTIADLAVAVGDGQIKSGAPCRSERTAKYNRLLVIEEELGGSARYGTDVLRRA